MPQRARQAVGLWISLLAAARHRSAAATPDPHRVRVRGLRALEPCYSPTLNNFDSWGFEQCSTGEVKPPGADGFREPSPTVTPFACPKI
ncbi:hypothetical protein EVAR_10979_1 [Eumeta japonica]|uniref:Secreted protein n=1 Tax=Eumeta variegata TaxID=151549 RepID=A0A4C1U699_EUMVA|nr:hypothetical protein EVAR_10979_1 [Eumeta japonica]